MTQAWDFVDADVLWRSRDRIMNFLVDDLELSIRSSHCLINANILTVGELIRHTPYDLMRIQNLGRKSLREIREELARIGLTLAHDQLTWETP